MTKLSTHSTKLSTLRATLTPYNRRTNNREPHTFRFTPLSSVPSLPALVIDDNDCEIIDKPFVPIIQSDSSSTPVSIPVNVVEHTSTPQSLVVANPPVVQPSGLPLPIPLPSPVAPSDTTTTIKTNTSQAQPSSSSPKTRQPNPSPINNAGTYVPDIYYYTQKALDDFSNNTYSTNVSSLTLLPKLPSSPSSTTTTTTTTTTVGGMSGKPCMSTKTTTSVQNVSPTTSMSTKVVVQSVYNPSTQTYVPVRQMTIKTLHPLPKASVPSSPASSSTSTTPSTPSTPIKA
ncbi:hypothetical protein SAMD00019534_043180 [Acytostelium subglobosum LB1]|uniref:hypothetical protein n=1 Tax=Acytostelium subglobosum LB1 TaxID=1410327 RepID=UPI0006449DD2|nr:hypothetical protein SAMD00019534_043180 [Acytostelium subglobosum LB1]GAM21143.1 hypothetical protein SAMD00019534_043180 [Acytostelium subglobosum LB1]|eukprot:XP_012756277.1 hypothetical protein SAMD00019534_043180 [Acytostelium subglobosum LB1]